MIGQRIDDALYQLEQENPSLKAVFNRNYARPSLEDRTLTELINLFSDIDFMAGRHDENESEQDVVGRVYEYCLKSFASLEGKRGGQFYTPPVVVRILVEMLEPYEGRVFDPCCGSGGMFVQSRKFIKEHSRKQPGLFNEKGISVYGQESNETTWRLCQMNLAVHGIDGDIKWNPEGSFLRDAHPDLRADFVIANPPFNDSDWSGHLLRDDPRWKLGVPPPGNANYAWIQHFLYHLNEEGFAGFVMANGSLSSQQSGEGDIRRRMVEEDLVDCIIALPGQLFYSTGIPVCLWFLANEAGLAASHLMAGVTALGKANYAERAYYYQAFFSLSVGIERTCKLILICDHMVKNGGAAPSEKTVRGFGHNLEELIAKVDEVAEGLELDYPRPDSAIHREMLRVLSTFAINGTRYYNIDTVLGKATEHGDPVADWYRSVVLDCWESCVRNSAKESVEGNARAVAFFMDGVASIRHTSEEGESLNEIYEASRRTGIWNKTAPYVRLHALQWCRYLGEVISSFSYTHQDIPVFTDFYAKFCNDDGYLKGRKAWSLTGR